MLACVFWLLASSPAPLLAAPPTQEDVFKSIQENVSESSDVSGLLPFLAAGAGLVILIAVVDQWRKRDARPRRLNHHGKLMREVLKAVPLRPGEVKLLKALAQQGGDEEPPVSPLTLLLCPSVLARTIRVRQDRSVKVDRRALANLARRVGVPGEALVGAGASPAKSTSESPQPRPSGRG